MENYTTDCIHYQVCSPSCTKKCQLYEKARPKGKWEVIFHKDLLGRWGSYYEYKCSACHKSYTDINSECKDSFCRFCGADMRGGAV